MVPFQSLIKPVMLCLILTLVSGCGFKPLHSQQKNAGTVGYSVTEGMVLTEVGWIGDREGQILRQSLVRQLNPRNDQTAKRWHLAVNRREYEQQLNLQKDETSRRARLVQIVNFSLVDKMTGEEVYSGVEQVSASFFIPQQTNQIFSLTVSKEDAKERSLKLASEAIVRRLSLFFNNPEMMRKRTR